ncbi:N-6 DNA methylase [Streptomyces sp. M10(2022)]
MNLTVSSRPRHDQALVERLWSFGNVLRDNGISGLEYIEQLSCLILLKRAHEQRERPSTRRTYSVSTPGHSSPRQSKTARSWSTSRSWTSSPPGPERSGSSSAGHKTASPTRLSSTAWSSTWLTATSGPQATPVRSSRAAGPHEHGHEDRCWPVLHPRPLIEAIVQCVQPGIEDTIADPACGTGGFLIKAFDYLVDNFPSGVTAAQRQRLNEEAFFGTELVDATARLATTNLVLHGITRVDEAHPCITVEDTLARPPVRRATLVLTTPVRTPLHQRGALPGGLLDHHHQPATQLPAARPQPAGHRWPGGRRGARQCAVRRRGR